MYDMNVPKKPSSPMADLIFNIFYTFMMASFTFSFYQNFTFILTLAPLLIIPILFPTKKITVRLFIYFLLLIPVIILHTSLIHYLEAGILMLPFFLFYVLLAVVSNHYVFRFINKKDSIKLKIWVIVFLFLISSFFISLGLNDISERDSHNHNSEIMETIFCESGYTSVIPEEIEALCDQIRTEGTLGDDRWKERKSECFDFVENIKNDKYYLGGFRSLGAWKEIGCKKNASPEALDPELCNHISDDNRNWEFGYEYSYADSLENALKICYRNALQGDETASFCEDMKSPVLCYSTIARWKSDESFCQKIDSLKYPDATRDCVTFAK